MNYKFIDDLKEKDSGVTDVLRILYRFGKNPYILPIASPVLGIIIPLFFSNNYFGWGIFFVVLLASLIFLNIYCKNYEKTISEKRKFASETIKNQSSTLNSLCINIRDDKNWKNKIFQKTSELVCEKVRNLFRDVFYCDTRVSVEYVFTKEDKRGNPAKHVKMSARRSPNRDTVKKAVPLENRKLYFSYRIFSEQRKDINVVTSEDMKNSDFWFKNPNHKYNPGSDVKLYLGIAVSALDNDIVDYILQIDFLSIPSFFEKKSTEDIQYFINQYLTAYINTITLSYLLNLNKYNKIPE